MKKAVSILLTAVLLLAMAAGCGSGKGSTEAGTEKEQPTQSTPLKDGMISYEEWEESFEPAPIAGKLPPPWDNLKKFTHEYVFRTCPDNVQRNLEGNVYDVGWPIVKDKITLKAFALQDLTISDIETHYFFENLEKKTNIHIEWTLATYDTLTEMRNVILASGEYPDIILSGLSKSDEVNLGMTQGIIMPLNDLIDKYGQYYKKMTSYRPEIIKATTLPDGKIYSLPNFFYNLHVRYPKKLWINKTWLDKLGMDVPKTTDEFEAALLAFKTRDPNENGKTDEIPFSASPKGWHSDMIEQLMSPFIVNAYDNGRIIVENGKIRYAPAAPEYQQGLKWLKKLYDQGLFDSQVFSNDSAQLQQLGENPDAVILGCFPGGWYGEALYGDPANPRIKDYVAVPPLEGPSGKSYTYYDPLNMMNGCFAITKSCKSPEAAMRWADWLYSPEADFATWYGRLGEEWDYCYGEEKNLLGDGPALYKILEYLELQESQNIVFGAMNLPYCEPIKEIYLGLASEGGDDYNSMMTKLTQELYVGHEMDEIPPADMYYLPAEAIEIAQIFTPLDDYVREATARFILGKMDIDTDWSSYLNEMQKLGLNRYLEIKQKAYDNYLKN
jgi:putative aldouronate transport system substrate-binding protein